MASVVLGVEPLPAGLHTLTLVEKEPTWTQGTLGYWRTPTGSAGAVAGWGDNIKGRRRLFFLIHIIQFVTFATSQQKTSQIYPTSTSAMCIQVIVSWTLWNTLPMMQGGTWLTAHALRVVRETGGTRRITGCEPKHVRVNGFRSERWKAQSSI